MKIKRPDINPPGFDSALNKLEKQQKNPVAEEIIAEARVQGDVHLFAMKDGVVRPKAGAFLPLLKDLDVDYSTFTIRYNEKPHAVKLDKNGRPSWVVITEDKERILIRLNIPEGRFRVRNKWMLFAGVLTKPPLTIPNMPTYQQGASNCTYYSVRSAIELVIGRKFSKDENQIFNEYVKLCPDEGSFFETTLPNFMRFFGDVEPFSHIEYEEWPRGARIGVRSRRGEPISESFVTIPEIVRLIDEGNVLLLEVANMAFRRDTIIPAGAHDFGHAITCFDYVVNEENIPTLLVCRDTNKFGPKKTNIKTIDISLIAENTQMLIDETDISRKTALQKTAFYISKCFSIYLKR